MSLSERFPPAPSSASVPVHDATELAKGGNVAMIRLGDQVYTLRITRAGKLILTQ